MSTYKVYLGEWPIKSLLTGQALYAYRCWPGKPLLKKQGFCYTSNSNFLDKWARYFLANQQGISHMGKGQDLPCCFTIILWGCTLYVCFFPTSFDKVMDTYLSNEDIMQWACVCMCLKVPMHVIKKTQKMCSIDLSVPLVWWKKRLFIQPITGILLNVHPHLWSAFYP